MSSTIKMTCPGWNTLGNVNYSSFTGEPLDIVKIPVKHRRRCTPISKLVLESYLSLANTLNINASNIPIVYASAHGEIGIFETMLETMFDNEALSPVDFCNSVHHTPSGYLSMVIQNTGISRTVSANEKSFVYGLLEVMNLMQEHEMVSLLAGDEPVGEVFGVQDIFPKSIFGASFVFKRINNNDSVLKAWTLDDVLAMISAQINNPFDFIDELNNEHS